MRKFSEQIELADGTIGHKFQCPGCNMPHLIYIKSETDPMWKFNNDVEKPTLTPSVKFRLDVDPTDWTKPAKHVCHSYVTAGKIKFLSDTTHSLAGTTVDLPDWTEDMNK